LFAKKEQVNSMANKNVINFVATYGPVAQQVSQEINVDPNVLLSQWGMESRWGQSEMAKKYHNLGGIKDFSGKGFKAKDNQTGSLDKYVKFEDPEVFGMYYANMIKQNFPKAVNTGPDVGAFTRGLNSGTKGSYFGVAQEEYEKSLTGAQNAIPEDQLLPFTPSALPATVDGPEGDMVVAPAPLASADPLPASDKSGASSGERFLTGAVGAGVGTLAAGAQAYGSQKTANAVRLAGLEEAARIAAQRSAGVTPPAQAGPLSGGQTSNAQSTRILQGTLGDEGTTGRARTTGFNTETSQVSARQKEMSRLLAELQRSGAVADDAPALFAKQPGLTSSPSGILLPRSDTPTTLGPRGPEGQIGYTRPPPPPPPSLGARTMTRATAGLDYVTDLFRDMMQPASGAMKTVGKYALPPLAGLSAGLDAAEMFHEYEKPEDQRDYAKMALKGASIVGGGLSMFPPAAIVGVPLSLGASAIQAYRESQQEAAERARRRMVGQPMR
jgi:hypothetical protein